MLSTRLAMMAALWTLSKLLLPTHANRQGVDNRLLFLFVCFCKQSRASTCYKWLANLTYCGWKHMPCEEKAWLMYERLYEMHCTKYGTATSQILQVSASIIQGSATLYYVSFATAEMTLKGTPAICIWRHCNIGSKRAFPTAILDRWHNCLLIYWCTSCSVPAFDNTVPVTE